MRDPINKLELLESNSSFDVVKLANNLQSNGKEGDKTKIQISKKINDIKIDIDVIENEQGDLVYLYSSFQLYVMVPIDASFDHSKIKTTLPEILKSLGFGNEIANEEIAFSKPTTHYRYISYPGKVSPEILKAINVAYVWRQINVEDL